MFAPLTSLTPRIAVVDDEEPVRKALQRLLRSAEYEVETFASGADFLASLSNPPACLVLDLHMPGVSGLTVLEHVASRIPVVVITAHDSADGRMRALDRGAVSFLRKPFDDVVLLDAISVAIASGSRTPLSESES
jgi:FixJ family two-component response regulator